MKRVVASLGLVLALAGAGCTQEGEQDASRDDTGAVTEESAVGVFRLQDGDCVMQPTQAELDVGISQLQAVPCDQPHDGEIYGLVLMDGDVFPGTDATIETSAELCLAQFETVTGIDYETDPNWDFTALFPTQDSWDLVDDREIVCIAVPLDGVATTTALPRA